MGRAWKFGNNIDTDVITPAEYLHQGEDEGGRPEWLDHVFEPIRPEFADAVEEGDIVVAGKNFGAGSSREAAARVFVMKGVDAVIAAEFARIWFRNAINVGLPVYRSEAASAGISDGDSVTVDHESGTITNETTGESYDADPLPGFVQEIRDAGGLANYYHTKVKSD